MDPKAPSGITFDRTDAQARQLAQFRIDVINHVVSGLFRGTRLRYLTVRARALTPQQFSIIFLSSADRISPLHSPGTLNDKCADLLLLIRSRRCPGKVKQARREDI